ncbi:DUF3592 domain-containing protein [Streptomyces sp. NRRL WC-3549]|uniref:DUF3592 domain-containing protein n=1 Tax=Streptomyces sp. NRRL WC-3549 TaxID=1463925 RepID=UPI00131AD4DC
MRYTYGRNGVAVVVGFETESGESFRCLGPSTAAACARVGEPVDVLHDPRHPKNAEVAPVRYGVAYAWSVLALVVLAPGIGLLVWILGG